VVPTTIQCVTIALICMLIVTLIFIPSPVCAIWVAFSIFSIEFGVIGKTKIGNVALK